MDFVKLFAIFFVGLGSSFIGTLVGGSSLINIPVLIFLGLSPHSAIATDRMGITGIGISGLYKFHQKGLVNYRIGLVIGIPVLVGSFIGANLVLQISPSVLKKVIVLITVSVLALLVMQPKLGVRKAQRSLETRDFVVGMFLSLLVGLYGGFYGAGAATFVIYILIFVFGQTFLESAGTMKIGSIAMTATATLTFAYHGVIHYPLAIAMFMGSFIGSFVGAHYSDRIGDVWLKRLFIGVVLIVAIKLLIS
jgi:uncharacterized membrane protein YfcA